MEVESGGLSERELRLGEIAAAHLKERDAGRTPDRQQLLARYPELAAELTEFLAGLEEVDRVAVPLREAVRATAAGWGADEATPRPDQSPLSSAELRSFGDYELLGVIGQGGMGVVYRARQKSLNRLVALKMIRAGGSPAEIRRFRNEAELAADLDHPHIVPVYEVGEHEGRLYFSLKLIEGGSLAERADHLPADPERAARLVAVVARAVHHAHQRGILHRDLKPANILLDGAGQPHVTDFGLARRVESDSSLTQSGALVGTPSYMAPEQTTGQKGVVTTAADVYGLGALLYTLLTGVPPFRADTVTDTLLWVRASAPVPPRRANPKVDRDLEAIGLKCLEKEPRQRYSSAEALADDLERWLNGEPIRARPIGRTCHLWRWCRRNPVVSGLVATTALLVVLGVVGPAVGVFLIWREKEQTKTALALADARTRETRQAVDKMYSQVAEKWLAQELGLELVQREFLEAALQFYVQFAQERGADPEVQLEAARAYYRTGTIRTRLGRPGIEEAYRGAYTLLTELTADSPQRPDYRHELVQTAIALGEFLTNRSRFREAEELFTRALVLATALVSEFPHEPAYQRDLVEAHRQLGRWLYHSGRTLEAEATARQVLTIQGSLMAKASEDANDKKLRSVLHGFLGIVSRYNGHLPEAEEHLDAALAILRELLAKDPKDPYSRHQIANYQGERAQVLSLAGRFREAEEAFNDALDAFQKLRTDYAAVYQPYHDLAYNSNNLAVVLAQTGRPREAAVAYRRALEWQAKMVAKHFDQEPALQRRQELAVIHHNLAWLLIVSSDPQVRDLKQAIEHAKKAVELEPGATNGSDVNTANCRKLPNLWNTLAVACYRRGDCHASIEALHRAMDLQGGPNGFDGVFLSMAHWQLGDKEQPRKWFDQAVKWMDEHKLQDEDLNGFRAEAATLLGIAPVLSHSADNKE